MDLTPNPNGDAQLGATGPRRPAALEVLPGPGAPTVWTRRTRWIILIVAVAAVVLVVVAARHALRPFIWAAVTAYILSPLVGWISRRIRVHRTLVVAAVYLLLMGGIILTLVLVIPPLTSELRELHADYPDLQKALVDKIMAGEKTIPVLGFNVDINLMVKDLTNNVKALIPTSPVRALSTVLGTLLSLLVFSVATFYLLADADRLGRFCRQAVPSPWREELTDLVQRINRVFGAYVRGQLSLVVMMSVATYLVIGPVLHVRYAILLSIFTGVAELFPFIGPIVAASTACLVAYLQGTTQFGLSTTAYTLTVAAVYLVLRQLEDNLVLPFVIGHAVRLHPLLVLLALFCGKALWGVGGMLLAVPIAAALRVLIAWAYGRITEPPPEDVPRLAATRESVGDPTP